MKNGFPHRRVLLATALAGAFPTWAAPQGEQVTAGSGAVTRHGAVTTITQDSARLAINWQSFGIAAGETVNFLQPGASAIALNRVVGGEASAIHGALHANGQVFLLNPNGVLFGRTAQVNVGGLLASTLDMSDADFLAGRHVLRGSGGAVRNEGSLRAADGGYIALVGRQVHNDGQVVADRGSVALAAGSRATLDFGGDGLLRLSVDQGALDALVRNGGVVQADGGRALLTAKAADALAGTVVNNTGVVRARTLYNRGGVVELLGGFEGGTVAVGGTLDVSAPAGGSAGFVETSGAHLKIAAGTQVKLGAAQGRSGRWLIDPVDIVVDAGAATALSAALESGDVTLTTSAPGADAGDITVNAPIAWSDDSILTLQADRHIALNAAIHAPAGGLALEAGSGISAPAPVNVGDFRLVAGNWSQVGTLPAFNATLFAIDGGSFLRATGGDGSAASPYRIADVYGLQGVASNASTLARYYLLANDLDAAGTVSWNSGNGFRPIGSMWDMFTGGFDGGGHVVSNLAVNWGGSDGVGLFGAVGATGSVRNVGVRGGSVAGFLYVGGLVGYNEGTLANLWSSARVDGVFIAGGLVGENQGAVSDSHAGGAVASTGTAGGFVGHNAGTITRAWATGAVSSSGGTGGFVGMHNGGSISLAYATGAVTTDGQASGGFVGVNQAAISDAYATGAVNSVGPDAVQTQFSGGFFGRQDVGGTLDRVYATGSVNNNTANRGALGGRNFAGGGTINNAYWNRTASGQTRAVAATTVGTEVSDANLNQPAGYPGLDFATTWAIDMAQAAPVLRVFLAPPPPPPPPPPAPPSPPAPAPVVAPPPASVPAPAVARTDLVRPPYPQPEAPKPATCLGQGEDRSASCVRALALQVVGEGVRLPPRP